MGAIYLDSGHNLETVWNVYRSVLFCLLCMLTVSVPLKEDAYSQLNTLVWNVLSCHKDIIKTPPGFLSSGALFPGGCAPILMRSSGILPKT